MKNIYVPWAGGEPNPEQYPQDNQYSAFLHLSFDGPAVTALKSRNVRDVLCPEDKKWLSKVCLGGEGYRQGLPTPRFQGRGFDLTSDQLFTLECMEERHQGNLTEHNFQKALNSIDPWASFKGAYIRPARLERLAHRDDQGRILLLFSYLPSYEIFTSAKFQAAKSSCFAMANVPDNPEEFVRGVAESLSAYNVGGLLTTRHGEFPFGGRPYKGKNKMTPLVMPEITTQKSHAQYARKQIAKGVINTFTCGMEWNAVAKLLDKRGASAQQRNTVYSYFLQTEQKGAMPESIKEFVAHPADK